MRPIEKIEQLVKKFDVQTNEKKDKAVLSSILKVHENSKKIHKSATDANMRQRTKFAAAAAIIFLVCLFTIRDVNHRQDIKPTAVELKSRTPAGLMTVISLNMAFRNGDMQALQNQLNEAERKLKPVPEKRITVNQLICELNEHDKI
jgi:hypothetical protein